MSLTQLHWTHPILGEISETACAAHTTEVMGALRLLGIGAIGSDGSVPISGAEGPEWIAGCLRCHAHPSQPPRVLLRQWFRQEPT